MCTAAPVAKIIKAETLRACCLHECNIPCSVVTLAQACPQVRKVPPACLPHDLLQLSNTLLSVLWLLLRIS